MIDWMNSIVLNKLNHVTQINIFKNGNAVIDL